MTVEKLFDHFRCFPDEIVYFDERDNIQDTVYIERITAEGEHEYDDERYNLFLNEYGEREVKDWYYRYDNVIELELR